MTDERYKQLMEQVGMPNSASLLTALQQVANEVAQETRKATAIKCSEIASNHEHDEDDFICCGENCGSIISAEIRREFAL